ncbi:hypothetical protein BDR26DRAFT_861229 [Obelidium mucronatum]|nr:hypothetical protein BDR26DRAFT_861229 [Obelidium mucronatum]
MLVTPFNRLPLLQDQGATFKRDILSLIPTEIAQQILFLLSPKDLASATRVSRAWNTLVDDKTIWQHVALSHRVNAFAAAASAAKLMDEPDPYKEAKQSVPQYNRWRKRSSRSWEIRDQLIVSVGTNGVVEVSDMKGERMAHFQVDVGGAMVSCMDAQWSLNNQCIWIAVGCFDRHVAIFEVSTLGYAVIFDTLIKHWTPRQQRYARNIQAVDAILVDRNYIITGSADGLLQTYNFKRGQVVATSTVHSSGRINIIQKRDEIMVVSSNRLLSIWKANNPSCIQSDGPWTLLRVIRVEYPIHSLVLTETLMVATSGTTLAKISYSQNSPATLHKQEESIKSDAIVLNVQSPAFSVYNNSFILVHKTGISFWEYKPHNDQFVQVSELKKTIMKGMNLVRISNPCACIVGSSHLVIGNGDGDLFILGF